MAEVLVVASKVKKYIKEKNGMSTSAAFIEAISEKVRELCDDAMSEAESAKRKTVMDRDLAE